MRYANPSIVFERSLNEGGVPDVFREAVFIPIHKRGENTKVSNKRNVSLTCSTCKLFESVISETILAHAVEQNLLCREQHAYRKGLSCCTQLLLYRNELARMINAGDSFDVIMFDFKSAFEQPDQQKFSSVCQWFPIDRDQDHKWMPPRDNPGLSRVRLVHKFDQRKLGKQ